MKNKQEKTALSGFMKSESDWLFNEEVGHVEPENFDAVYETVTSNFRLGGIAVASQVKTVFQILDMMNDPNAKKVIDYMQKFVEEQTKEIELGTKYL